MRLRILILAILFALGAKAQDSAGIGYTMVSVSPQSDAIWVKFIGKQGYYPEGFDIYRSEENGSWEKIATAIKPNLNASVSDFKSEESYKLFKAILSLPYSEFQTSLGKGLLLLNALEKNDFAGQFGLFYEDKSASKGTAYRYKVEVNGASTAPSLNVQFNEFSGPDAPKEGSVERGKKVVKLKWTPESKRYYAVNVYRKSGDADFKKLNETPIPIQADKSGNYSEFLYEDKNIAKDSSYTYKITAVDYFFFESKTGLEIEAKAVDLEAPPVAMNQTIASNAASKTISLTWQMPQNSDATEVKIYSRNSPKEDPILIAEGIDPKSGVYLHQVSGEGTYYMSIAMVDAAGNMAIGGELFTSISDVFPPAVPANFKVSMDSGLVQFVWDAVTAEDFAGYMLFKRPANEPGVGYKPVFSEPISKTNFELQLPPNMLVPHYYYIASADVNYNYSGSENELLVQLPDITAPKQPVITNIKFNQEGDERLLVIEWLANVDADLSHYTLEKRLKNSEVEFEKVNFQPIPKTAKSYTDKLATDGERYEYRLIAIDTNDLKSAPSISFFGSLPKLAEDIAPADVEIGVNNRKKSINITWKNGPDQEALLGYTVYRADENGIFMPVSGLVKTTQFKQSGLTAGTTYKYQIRAYSTSGFEVAAEPNIIEIKSE